MKKKFVQEFWDKDTGFYSLVMQNKYGRFYGWSQATDDETYPSELTGAKYAEIRAAAEYAKFRYKSEKVKLNTIKDLLKTLEHNKINTDEKTLRQIKIKLRDYTQSVSDWGNLYNHLRTLIPKLDQEREKIQNRTKKDN